MCNPQEEPQSDSYNSILSTRSQSRGFTDRWDTVDYAMAGLSIAGSSLPLGIGLAEFYDPGTIDPIVEYAKDNILEAGTSYNTRELAIENSSEVNKFVSETISSLAL